MEFHGENKSSRTGIDRHFERLSDPKKVLKILKSRLPLAAGIYNVAKIFDNWTKEMEWFLLDGEISSDSWVMVITKREDYGQEICISRPPNCELTEVIKKAFSSCNSIDWNGTFLFCALDTQLSTMIADVCVRIKGNATHVHPSYLCTMDIEEALLIDDDLGFNLEEGVTVKDLDNESGKNFILSTWKYAIEGSDKYIRKCLSRNESVGVYVKDEPVSGVLFVCHGFLGMLYTLQEQRGNGYAKLCMLSMMKKLAQNGIVPSCAVEMKNKNSLEFQTKIGFTVAATIDYIVCEKSGF